MGFNNAENLSGVGMPPELLLGEEQGPVNSDLEHAARPLDKSDLGSRMGLLDLRLQTGGAWTVVSNDAILNRYFHGRPSAIGLSKGNAWHPVTADTEI